MTRYQAIINTPGYLSEQDDLIEFDSIKEAWEYLAEERERCWDWGMEELPEGEESALESLRSQDLCSVVVLPTPGEPRLYDLGVAYTVTEAPHCTHSWVGGMMVIHPEDLATVAATGRVIECERCGEEYQGE